LFTLGPGLKNECIQNRVTRRPRFSGTVPDLGPLSPAEGVPENVPDFDNWPPRLDS